MNSNTEYENQNRSQRDSFQENMVRDLHNAHIIRMHTASHAYDRTMLSLATASLGFTFTYIKLANHGAVLKWICLLVGSWFFLSLSIVFILLAFIADQIYSDNEIKRYQGHKVNEMPCIQCMMSKSPKIAGGCFFLAIVLFTFFVFITI